jgi:ABC-2 type transport system ATP-binding protein
LGNPPILILDEPTIGLDPKQIREIRQLIKGFSKNRTVILSTHILPEVSQVCDRVIIINKGSIVAEDSPTNLLKSHGKFSRTQVVARAKGDEIAALFSGIPGIHSVHASDVGANGGEATATVEANPDIDIRPTLARAVMEKGWDLLELRSLQVSLEDVFIDLITEENEEQMAPEQSEGKEETA